MKQATIWTAAAAVVTLGAIDAQAAPQTYQLEFSPTIPGPAFGNGFFTIDDSILTPSASIFDPSVILDFEANFFNSPFGDVSFDEGDLNALNLKTNASGEISTVSFGTTQNGSDPFLQSGIFDFITLTANDGNPETTEPSITFQSNIVAVPEPGSLALLAAGAAGLPLIRRRRAKRADA